MFVVVVAFVLLIYVALITWKPPAILAAMLSIYAVEQAVQSRSAFFASHPQLMNYAFGFLTIYAVAISWMRFGSPIRDITAVAWIIYGLFAASWVSYFWSINPGFTKEVTSGYLPYVVVSGVLLPLVFRRMEDFQSGITTFIIFAVPVVAVLLAGDILGLTGRSLQLSQYVEDRYGRLKESGNPLAIASFAGYLVICCLFVQWRGVGRVVGILRWVLVALAFALQARSQSRGQFAAAVAVPTILVIFPAILGWRLRNVGLAVVIALFMVFVVPWAVSYSLFSDRFDVTNWGTAFYETRVQDCLKVLQYWLNTGKPVAWLFGMGAGSSWHAIDGYPHVVPVEILVELGVFGLIAYLVLMSILAATFLRMMFQLRKDVYAQSIFMIVLGLWMFETIMSFKQGTFLSSVEWMAFSVMLARMSIFVRREQRSRMAYQNYVRWQRNAQAYGPAAALPSVG